MARSGDRLDAAIASLDRALDDMGASLDQQDGAALGEALIRFRERIDRSEAMFVGGVGRFDKSGDYREDGALTMANWLRWKCRLSGSAAAERVTVAQQLQNLPRTQAAFANGDLGYQHVAVIARTAEHLGSAAVRQVESELLPAAETRDPGQLVAVAKELEHRIDREAALREANHAYSRRYLHLTEPDAGMIRVDGVLDLEGGAVLKTALDALMRPPAQGDHRTAGQRRADALVELARQPLDGSKLGSTGGQRPHLVITASAETLAGVPGAPPAHLEGIGPITGETAQRFACDSTVSWLLAQAELENETSHAQRRIAPSTRRALVARDGHCVFPGCSRPPQWCDGHHLKYWTQGGRTELTNLALLCGPHHRMVHEEGWQLQGGPGDRWIAIPPGAKVPANARSA